MKLSKVLEGIEYNLIKGEIDSDIREVQYDSRKVTNEDLFVCIQGFNVDGHNYAGKAVENGASVLVCSQDLDKDYDCTIIKVKDTRKALAVISSNFYDNPSKSLKLIGITGTNGKTTSTYMVKSVLEHAGYNVGIIGTIANYIGKDKVKSERTTPESLELHKLFKAMKDKNIDYCVMEVSSHSLSLNRVFGLTFEQAAFTNLTRDHLDFHKTFENYYEAKLKLFKNSKSSIINIDDTYGKKFIEDIASLNGKITTYSTVKGDIVAKNIVNHSLGAEFDLCYKNESVHIKLSLPGIYNVYNALDSAGICINEGISLKTIQEGIQNVVVPGRCENVTKGYDLGFDVIVDYAHTPDGLENILKTAREFTEGRLISVFGCGGDRDKTKRPLMGKIGTDLSDIAVITSDNPRSEDPALIIKDIVKGVEKDNYIVIEDRKEAIKKAIKLAQKGDVIVVAGKGHEDYQILKDKVIHFDEREVIADIIKELF